jgi:hypothetical protein
MDRSKISEHIELINNTVVFRQFTPAVRGEQWYRGNTLCLEKQREAEGRSSIAP